MIGEYKTRNGMRALIQTIHQVFGGVHYSGQIFDDDLIICHHISWENDGTATPVKDGTFPHFDIIDLKPEIDKVL